MWGVAAFAILVAGLSVTVSLLPLVVGAFVWVGFVHVLRWTTYVDRLLAGWQREERVQRVYRIPAAPGLLPYLRTLTSDPQTWRDLAWLAVTSVVGFAWGLAVLTAAGLTLAYVSMPIWYWAVEDPRSEYGVTNLGVVTVDTLGEAAAAAVLGIALIPLVLLFGRGAPRRTQGSPYACWVRRQSRRPAPRPAAVMPDIELIGITKRYGSVTAVDDLTVDAYAGRITAFLGANGSGKTTTMRILLGLSEPDSGSARIGGQRYRELPHPPRVVGAVLDQGFHPNRNARNHLRIVAAQAGVAAARVDDVLGQVGLVEAADRRVGGFSLGMRQRLNLAAAMIGEPETLVLDEPFNGLDPAGIQSMREFLRAFADAGGTVLLSSHLLSEIAHSADDAIIIDRGHLVGSGPVASLAPASQGIRVTTPDVAVLTDALRGAGAQVHDEGIDAVTVSGLSSEAIGRIALDARVLVTDLRSMNDGLEAVFAALIQRTDSGS